MLKEFTVTYGSPENRQSVIVVLNGVDEDEPLRACMESSLSCQTFYHE